MLPVFAAPPFDTDVPHFAVPPGSVLSRSAGC